MGQPTTRTSADPGARTSPADDYRTPLLPGGYPPLGYSATGIPRFRPGDLTAPSAGAVPGGEVPAGGPSAGDPGSVAVTPPPRSAAGGRRILGLGLSTGITVGAIAVVVVVVLGVVMFGTGLLRRDRQTIELPQATPTAELPPEITGLPTSGRVPHTSGAPRVPGGGALVEPGTEVTYTVTIDGTGTILYVDDEGIRTEVSPGQRWTLTFSAGVNPVRLLVIVGRQSSATCAISVAGRTIVADRVTADSRRRTAACVPG
ncbi:MAG: hypothetical protein QM662_04960 [Gordonia sp. (in: high G+C Gram-positive bacteria)]